MDKENQLSEAIEAAFDKNAQDAVVIERSFDAPVELIWQMWTDPEHFKAWYGPDGATIPVAKMDVRVGGSRLVCMEMQTPDGPMQMWFTGEYREVVPPERIVWTFEYEPLAGHISIETMTLTERDGRTLLTVRDAFASKEDRDGMLQSGMESGARETYERLDEVLAGMAGALPAAQRQYGRGILADSLRDADYLPTGGRR